MIFSISKCNSPSATFIAARDAITPPGVDCTLCASRSSRTAFETADVFTSVQIIYELTAVTGESGIAGLCRRKPAEPRVVTGITASQV